MKGRNILSILEVKQSEIKKPYKKDLQYHTSEAKYNKEAMQLR